MGNDTIGYFFIILLLLIAAPLIFWILSLLYAWVKWLFNDKKKLNESFSMVEDINNPIHKDYKISYKLGSDSDINLTITDVKFNVLKQFESEKKVAGIYSYMLDSTLLSNGKYFIQLTTHNQKITKEIYIEN